MAEGTIAQVLAGEATWCVEHGDCAEVLRGFPESSGVVVTDVPYGIGKAIANDAMPWEEWLPWLDARLVECIRAGRLVFSFFAPTRLIRFIRETTVPPQFEINWHKPMMLHGRALNGSPFLVHRECILYWGPMRPKEAGKLGYDSVAYNSMWPWERRKDGVEHPTPKPVPLVARSLERWARPGELVIDPFCGSGSHLVAARRTGRPCIGIDIDERWVEHARDRLRAEEHGLTLGDVNRGQGGLFT